MGYRVRPHAPLPLSEPNTPHIEAKKTTSTLPSLPAPLKRKNLIPRVCGKPSSTALVPADEYLPRVFLDRQPAEF